MDNDVVGGRDRALADVLRHQEEVVPIPLRYLRGRRALMVETTFGSLTV